MSSPTPSLSFFFPHFLALSVQWHDAYGRCMIIILVTRWALQPWFRVFVVCLSEYYRCWMLLELNIEHSCRLVCLLCLVFCESLFFFLLLCVSKSNFAYNHTHKFNSNLFESVDWQTTMRVQKRYNNMFADIKFYIKHHHQQGNTHRNDFPPT